MSSLRKALLAGVAAIGIGLAGAASRRAFMYDRAGSGRRRRADPLTGEVPPQIAFVPAPAAFDPWMQVSSVFGLKSPFAMLDRMAG